MLGNVLLATVLLLQSDELRSQVAQRGWPKEVRGVRSADLVEELFDNALQYVVSKLRSLQFGLNLGKSIVECHPRRVVDLLCANEPINLGIGRRYRDPA